MPLLFSLLLRTLAVLINASFLTVSIVLFTWAFLVPFSEFMISVNAWPDSWLSASYIPMTTMEQVGYALKSTMLAIAFYAIGEQIEAWSKKLPSITTIDLEAQA